MTSCLQVSRDMDNGEVDLVIDTIFEAIELICKPSKPWMPALSAATRVSSTCTSS